MGKAVSLILWSHVSWGGDCSPKKGVVGQELWAI